MTGRQRAPEEPETRRRLREDWRELIAIPAEVWDRLRRRFR